MAVLDLFSGTGALGLEALSRGAKEAVFIEPQVIAAQAIRASLATLGMDNGAVNTQLAEQYLKGSAQSFDLVFIDPPFSLDLWDETLATLVTQNWLSSRAFIYLECPKHMTVNIPSELTTIKDKTGGQVRFRLLQKRN
jgi:16S rRNA (guanine966-N2)-methyltransferase